MKNNNPYECFPNYVLRAPLLSLDFYQTLTQDSNITDAQFKAICADPVIRESLFLASPSLFDELNKWAEGNLKEEKEQQRFKHSLLKYISRMSSRCTPFGLFAGCALGSYGDETNIQLKEAGAHSRHTRLDMNYLVSLAQNLAQRPEIKSQLLFFPNSSIYEVGHQLRYVEYQYINSRRHHHIASVSNSEYLAKIFDFSREGAALEAIAKTIVEEDISFEEAIEFVNELVENQLLISELEPSVSGPEFLEQIIEVLENIKEVDEILKTLYNIRTSCAELDKKLGNATQGYLDLSESLSALDTTFEAKFLFQTDLVLEANSNQLSKKVAYSVRRGLTFLNKISPPPTETMMTKFRQAFTERYESREVPLSKALDLEIGIGFQQNLGSDDPDPILNDLVLPGPVKKNIEYDLKWNSVHQVLNKLILKAIKEDAQIISLKEDDFEFLEADWKDTPDTISFMIEVLNMDGEEKIKIISNGGSSAANLLGRFCHGDADMLAHTKRMMEVEEKINSDKIMAEIVHLPEARVGNVLMRPVLRKAEIPYLAKSVLPEDQQLPLEDLAISVRGKRVRIRSIKNNKEVTPRLSNAHNFMNNALPIYQFLATAQTQNLRGSVGLQLGPLVDEFDFLPRFEYQNLILRPASWKIKKEALAGMLKVEKEDKALAEAVHLFCKEKKLPPFVLLIDGDNELLINLENLTSVRMLLGLVKKRTSFKLNEFLFGKEELVKNGSSAIGFTNQFILSFYHQQRLNQKEGNHENTKRLYHW